MSVYNQIGILIFWAGIFFLSLVAIISIFAVPVTGCIWFAHKFLGMEFWTEEESRECASRFGKITLVLVNVFWVSIVGILALAYAIDALGGTMP